MTGTLRQLLACDPGEAAQKGQAMDVPHESLRVAGKLASGLLFVLALGTALGQTPQAFGPPMNFDGQRSSGFPIFDANSVTPVCVSGNDAAPVRKAVESFRDDVARVSGKPGSAAVTCSDPEKADRERDVILVGSIGHSELLDRLIAHNQIAVAPIRGKWEAALVQEVERPLPHIRRALVIAGSDPRGAAFALYDLSRAMGVSPWNWWADVPVQQHRSVFVTEARYIQDSPAVQFRGIFLNDEDWGLRPWAAGKMDPALHNIGPNTYARIFELLMRLHANTLWPAMHPGSMPFHMVPENARLAAEWGIVMGSSHSEALLRNNVGEWDEGRDGPWDYQTNRDAIRDYWERGVKQNGNYDNIYTVGMRGQHDSGLKATGTVQDKARLVEQVMEDQRAILTQDVNPDLSRVPQVLWLYKESIDLYRAGMKVPDDVTLGWTDDNYGYMRQLPDAEEQRRSGGSALYYHVSYWGAPHDYLWLASTPLALMREELTKSWDHGVRRMWILNVGDLKPAEKEIDYFLQLAWRTPKMRDVTQSEFLQQWFGQTFPPRFAGQMAAAEAMYYHLNFIRKPEFIGFNGYTDEVRRSAFNPLAWGDQNRQRLETWNTLAEHTDALAHELPSAYRDAFFELVQYPVNASAAQNRKFLWTDRSYIDQHAHEFAAVQHDADRVKLAYQTIQSLTAQYNHLADGKWNGMMSSHPRDRRVFELPETALRLATAPEQLPEIWVRGTPSTNSTRFHGFGEIDHTVSMDAAHFSEKSETGGHLWHIWPELGLSNGSVGIAAPGLATEASWLRGAGGSPSNSTSSLTYAFTVIEGGNATLSLALLPTFPVDSEHRLRYAVALDGNKPVELDAAGSEQHRPNLSDWSANVLSNAAFQRIPLGELRPGQHTVRLLYGDPGVLFQHLTITFAGAPSAYPFPPETHSE